MSEYINKGLIFKTLNEMGNHYPESCLAGISAVTEELFKLPVEKIPSESGTYECFHCLSRSVIWDADFYEGEGIIHVCHCNACGADILYAVPAEGGENGKETEKQE